MIVPGELWRRNRFVLILTLSVLIHSLDNQVVLLCGLSKGDEVYVVSCTSLYRVLLVKGVYKKIGGVGMANSVITVVVGELTMYDNDS